MAGFGPNKKKVRHRGFSEINVTPFVDVMLVLLVVFMVTAPMMNVGVPVDLPKTNATQQANDQMEALVVSMNVDGKIFIGENEVNVQDLTAQLKMMTIHNPEAKIYVRGDQQLPYGRIMELMGIISQSGLHKVSLMAETPVPKIK
jgi:biopolymer transport protein TolR